MRGCPTRPALALAIAAALFAAGCDTPSDGIDLPDAISFDGPEFDINIGDTTFDVPEAAPDAGAEAEASTDGGRDADADASLDAPGDADAADAPDDADTADASDAAEAGPAPKPLASPGLAAGGGVARSGAYRLTWSVGASAPGAQVSSSSKYRLRGGVVGANGSTP
jgi:hypothetical protein